MIKWRHFSDHNDVIDSPEETAATSNFIFWNILFRRMYFQNSQCHLQLSYHFTNAKLAKISKWHHFSDHNDVINSPGIIATTSNFIFRPISFRWMYFQSFFFIYSCVYHFISAKLSKISKWRHFSDNNDVIDFPEGAAATSNFIFWYILFRRM